MPVQTDPRLRTFSLADWTLRKRFRLVVEMADGEMWLLKMSAMTRMTALPTQRQSLRFVSEFLAAVDAPVEAVRSRLMDDRGRQISIRDVHPPVNLRVGDKLQVTYDLAMTEDSAMVVPVAVVLAVDLPELLPIVRRRLLTEE